MNMEKSHSDLLANCITYTILIMLLITPLLFISEINIGLGGLYVIPDLGLRTIKEYGMVFIIILSLLYSLIHRRFNRLYKYLPLLLLCLIIILLNSQGTPTNVLLCGFRWILPLFLPIFLYNFVNDSLLKKCYNVVSVVFLFHFLLQIVELFVMPPYNGTTFFGLTARVPGMYVRAHGAAYFTCLYYLLILGYEKNSNRRLVRTIAVILSLLIASSSTGVIVFLATYFLHRYRKSKHFHLALLLLPIIIYIAFINADTITNRKNGSSESSVGTRVERLGIILDETSFVSNNFGYSTNGVFTLSNTTKIKTKKSLFADSFYNSLLGNLGWFFSLVIIFTILFVFFSLLQQRNIYPLQFLLFYVLFSISNIVTEVYPGNLFIGIVGAYFLKYNSINKRINCFNHSLKLK